MNPTPHTETKNSFMARCNALFTPEECIMVELAYDQAKHYHRAAKRKELDANGEPIRYFEHPRRVALLSLDQFSIGDPVIVQACLLHDMLEDTPMTSLAMERIFGSEVCRTVMLVTKSPSVDYWNRLVKHGTPRAWTVKLLDRLDNLTHMEHCSPEFRFKQALETTHVLFQAYSGALCHTPTADLLHTIVQQTAKQILEQQA